MEDKLRNRIEKGLPTPSLDNRPLLYEDLNKVYEIWWLLHAGRSRGFGLCPIQLSEIYVAFLVFNIYDREEQKEYISYLYAMEGVFFKWIEEKESQDKGKSK